MNEITKQHLKMLEIQHPKQETKKASRLKVYYGFSKINKIQKREAIQVTFENEQGAGSEGTRSGKTLRKLMDIVTWRYQTEQEASDASSHNRVFTSYHIFLDDKRVNGSLKKALQVNSEADKNHLSEKERKEIADRLETSFIASHVGYKEPKSIQQEIPFVF